MSVGGKAARLAVCGRQAALQAGIAVAPEKLGWRTLGRALWKAFWMLRTPVAAPLPSSLPPPAPAAQALSRGTKRQNGPVCSLGLQTPDAALSPSSHTSPCCWDLCDGVSVSSSAASR